jgi:hypothetical protein
MRYIIKHLKLSTFEHIIKMESKIFPNISNNEKVQVSKDQSTNVKIDQINEEINQINEWDTIQPSNIQDKDCSWNSETNQTDQTHDEEWLKPNPQVVFVEATTNEKISWDSITEWERYHKKTIPIKWRQRIESELELQFKRANTETEKIDLNWFTIYHVDRKPLSDTEIERYNTTMPIGWYKDLPKPRNR